MLNRELVLGIDTSNYTTSLALTDHDGVTVIDSRKPLIVKQGERGLRQSHALFQHMENLPEMILDLFQQVDKDCIKAVAVSSRPRPVDGSYMPVFKAGVNYGKVLAASLGVPFFEFSHQEGHLEAVNHGSNLSQEKEFLAYHLSGGTCEFLRVSEQSIIIIGGTKDISFGQVIDRIGVSLNMEFPAGKDMDMRAILARDEYKKLTTSKDRIVSLKKIPLDGLYFNLSGIETQCQRALSTVDDIEQLIYELFHRIGESLCILTERAVTETGFNKVLFTGGVSASRFIRDMLWNYFRDKGITLEFGNPALSYDNAVGISFLGGKELWL